MSLFAVYQGSKEHNAWKGWYAQNGLFRATLGHGVFTVGTDYPPRNDREVQDWEWLQDLASNGSSHGKFSERKSYVRPAPWRGVPFENKPNGVAA